MVPFWTGKTLTLPEPFIVETETYKSNEKKNDNQLKKFFWSCLTGNTDTTEINLLTWAGTSRLIIWLKITTNTCGFFAISPRSHDSSCNCIHFYTKLCETVKPAKRKFCNEGVFRLVLNIYLKHPQEFKNLVMLGGFHTAKCVQKWIGQYIKGTGLEDALVETGLFGVKVMESILAATSYVQSLQRDSNPFSSNWIGKRECFPEGPSHKWL